MGGEPWLSVLAKLSIVACLSISSIQSACDVELSVEFEAVAIFENGSAWDGLNLYPNGTYWTESGNGSSNATTWGCPCSVERPCLRKCCPYGQQMVDLECAEDGNGEYEGQWFRPEVSDDGNVTREVDDAGHFHVVAATRACGGFSMHPEVEGRDAFFIRASDGKLCLLGDGNDTCLGAKEFCLDYVPDSGAYLPFVCPEEQKDQQETEVKKEEVLITLYEPLFEYVFVASISASTLFLTVTFLVYALIPELRTLPGKCHMCHVFSVLAYNAVHLVFSVMNTVLIRHPWITCYAIDIPNYFFYFTSFSWLNVICYDICMAFIELRPIASPIRQHEFKRFAFYSLYAWSAPLLVFCACVLLEHLTLSEENPHLRLGNLCSEPTISYSWLYHIAPMSFLMVCNVILFVVTAVNLYRAKRSTAVLAESGNRRSQDENRRQRFKMYLKLLIVMGLNWSVEPVYWSLHSWVSNGFTPQLWRVLHIMVIISYLQGFFIFLIFVCNDRVIKLIKMRIARLKRSKRAQEYWSNLNCCVGNDASHHSSQSNVIMRW